MQKQKQDGVWLYDRKTGIRIEEDQSNKRLLEFLYGNPLGRFLLWSVIARPWVSKLGAWQMSRKSSVRKIAPFVERYNIDLSECEQQTFSSFNDFFTRKRNNRTTAAADELVSCADCRLSVYPIDADTVLRIKHSQYTVAEILDDAALAQRYQGGTCVIYRLAVDDYHRYVFNDNGTLGQHRFIPGLLHTVRAVSEAARVYSRNAREWTILETEHFGTVVQIEVGATMVGKIRNHRAGKTFRRLEEKGYFEYGGSTVVQLFEKDRVVIDESILTCNASGMEVKVRVGEKIGAAKTRAAHQ